MNNSGKFRFTIIISAVLGIIIGFIMCNFLSPYISCITNKKSDTNTVSYSSEEIKVEDDQEIMFDGITQNPEKNTSTNFTKTELTYNSVPWGFTYGNAEYGYFLLPDTFEQVSDTSFYDKENDTEVSFDVVDLKGDFTDKVSSIKDEYIKNGYVITDTQIESDDNYGILCANYGNYKVWIEFKKDILKDYIHIYEYKTDTSINSLYYSRYSYYVDYPQQKIDSINSELKRMEDIAYQNEINNNQEQSGGFDLVYVGGGGGTSNSLFIKCYQNNK